MAKDLNTQFRKGIQMANTYLKNMFNSIRNQINADKSNNKVPYWVC